LVKEKLVIEAYRKAFDYPDDIRITLEDVASHIKFLEKYQELDMLDEFGRTPMQYIHFQKPVNSAKQIALEASVKLTVAFFELRGRFNVGTKEDSSEAVKLADEIYQWLIKKNSE